MSDRPTLTLLPDTPDDARGDRLPIEAVQAAALRAKIGDDLFEYLGELLYARRALGLD